MSFGHLYLICSSFLNKNLTTSTFLQEQSDFSLQKQQYLRKEPLIIGIVFGFYLTDMLEIDDNNEYFKITVIMRENIDG